MDSYLIKNGILSSPTAQLSSNIGPKASSFNSFEALDRSLDLGSTDRFIFSQDVIDSNPEEFSRYLKMLAKLLKKGIVGYEYLERNGIRYKSFLTTSMGYTASKGAKRVRSSTPYKPFDDHSSRGILS